MWDFRVRAEYALVRWIPNTEKTGVDELLRRRGADKNEVRGILVCAQRVCW